MLALGKAFLLHPKVLCIDELSLGLAPALIGELLEIVREIHRRGTTVVVVEQSFNIALSIATTAVFMEKGEVRFSGTGRGAAANVRTCCGRCFLGGRREHALSVTPSSSGRSPD